MRLFNVIVVVLMMATLAGCQTGRRSAENPTPGSAQNIFRHVKPMDPAQIARIQGILTELGYYNGPINGIFGQKTAEAIEQFFTNEGGNPVIFYGNNAESALIDARAAGRTANYHTPVAQRTDFPPQVREMIARFEGRLGVTLGPEREWRGVGMKVAPIRWYRRDVDLGIVATLPAFVLSIKEGAGEGKFKTGDVISAIDWKGKVGEMCGENRPCKDVAFRGFSNSLILTPIAAEDIELKIQTSVNGRRKAEVVYSRNNRSVDFSNAKKMAQGADWAAIPYSWVGVEGIQNAAPKKQRETAIALLGAIVRDAISPRGKLEEVEILSLTSGGPLSAVGVREGDRVDHFDGGSLAYGNSPSETLEKYIRERKSGDRVPFYSRRPAVETSSQSYVTLYSGAANPCARGSIKSGQILIEQCPNEFIWEAVPNLYKGNAAYFHQNLGGFANTFDSQYDDMMIWAFLEEYSDRCRNSISSARRYDFMGIEYAGADYGYAVGYAGFGLYQKHKYKEVVKKSIYLDPRYYNLFAGTVGNASKRAFAQWKASGPANDYVTFVRVLEKERGEMKQDVVLLLSVDGCDGPAVRKAMSNLPLLKSATASNVAPAAASSSIAPAAASPSSSTQFEDLFGMSARPMPSTVSGKIYAEITRVLRASNGLEVGDWIVEVGQDELTSLQHAVDLARGVQRAGKKSILLLVMRGGESRFVVLPLP
ncbi:peptidoglycan-binding protein [Oceanibaculum nanhaiense]|uniref:peptidoglycan-binding protein n=1 Tax=Oceanibaculum nanhaiense TaxID=1909734 RepID=UPI003F6ED536